MEGESSSASSSGNPHATIASLREAAELLRPTKNYQRPVGDKQKTDCESFEEEEERRGTKRPSDLKLEEPCPKFSTTTAANFYVPLEQKQLSAPATHRPEQASSSRSFVGTYQTSSYISELISTSCVDVSNFSEAMFDTRYGRLVFMVKPWIPKLDNVYASCMACKVSTKNYFNNKAYTLLVNGIVLAQAPGNTKAIARKGIGDVAFTTLKNNVISILVKEQYSTESDSGYHQSTSTQPPQGMFGTPILGNAAIKLLQAMECKRGGIVSETAGRYAWTNLQMVTKENLGIKGLNMNQLKNAIGALFRQYYHTASIDVELVFSPDFSKEERAAVHMLAKPNKLVSKSFGTEEERYLLVKKKLDPFQIVEAVVREGGNTAKYRVFLPT